MCVDTKIPAFYPISNILLPQCVCLWGSAPDPAGRGLQRPRPQLGNVGSHPCRGPRNPTIRHWLPVMVYGSETWALKKAHMELQLSVAQRKMERIMLSITLRDHRRNTWIRHQTCVNYIICNGPTSLSNAVKVQSNQSTKRFITTTMYYIKCTGARLKPVSHLTKPQNN